METQEHLHLIKRYLASVQVLVGQLQRAFQVENLVEGRKEGKIPRTGTFGDDGEFSFHGVGCRIEKGETSVDFDFGPNGRIDGFDAWRLHVFVEDDPSPEESGIDTTERGLKVALKELLAKGMISQIEGDSLYYLAGVV